MVGMVRVDPVLSATLHNTAELIRFCSFILYGSNHIIWCNGEAVRSATLQNTA